MWARAVHQRTPRTHDPFVGFKKELHLQVAVVHRAAKEDLVEKKVKLNYQVTTMGEIPRGALTDDEIAQTAEFFSFGTNHLAQTCLGEHQRGGSPSGRHYSFAGRASFKTNADSSVRWRSSPASTRRSSSAFCTRGPG